MGAMSGACPKAHVYMAVNESDNLKLSLAASAKTSSSFTKFLVGIYKDPKSWTHFGKYFVCSKDGNEDQYYFTKASKDVLMQLEPYEKSNWVSRPYTPVHPPKLSVTNTDSCAQNTFAKQLMETQDTRTTSPQEQAELLNLLTKCSISSFSPSYKELSKTWDKEKAGRHEMVGLLHDALAEFEICTAQQGSDRSQALVRKQSDLADTFVWVHEYLRPLRSSAPTLEVDHRV